MAEKPIDTSLPFDDGGGASVGSRGFITSGNNNPFKSDLQQFNELNSAFERLNKHVKQLRQDLPNLITQTATWAKHLQVVATRMDKIRGGTGGGGYIQPAGSLTQQVLSGGGSLNVDRSQTVNYYAGGAGGGGLGTGSPKDAIKTAIADGFKTAMAAMNARIEANAGYSLSANRMDMLLQQTTGMSRQSVYANMRQPLQQYKLGMGGINEVLALQASTGINAGMQAKSVEALRAASGYGYSTADINQMTRGLANPQSANRMFMMMGTGLYGIGGKQKSTQQVVNETIQRLGLTNEEALKGAMAPGSVTRERMRQSGLPEDMQDLVLQMAQQNIQYGKKGGRGMYDASSKRQRALMGVEGAYANQFEETERVKAGREENMYKRQADNYAAMERQIQSVTRNLQKLDDALASITGLKIRNRGIGGILKSVAPIAGTLIGSAFGAPVLGTMAGSMLSSFFGDGDTGFASKKTTNKVDQGVREQKADALKKYVAGARIQAIKNNPNVIRNKGQLSKVNPKFRERLEAMLAANPKLSIGQGVRSREKQAQMFFDRYRQTDKKTDMFWKGTYWEHVKGPAAAPPGLSMHEIGLAADLQPSSEFDWIKQNASKFGLRSFYDVNNEPWHVQPSELPGDRETYERKGAPWGHNGAVEDQFDFNAKISPKVKKDITSENTSGAAATAGAAGASAYTGMSMGATIEAISTTPPKSGDPYPPRRNKGTVNYTGDPMSVAPSQMSQQFTSGMANSNPANSYNVTISPNITISSSGNNSSIDAQRIAREVAQMLDREVRLTLMRTS